jgi:hypothetical protein
VFVRRGLIFKDHPHPCYKGLALDVRCWQESYFTDRKTQQRQCLTVIKRKKHLLILFFGHFRLHVRPLRLKLVIVRSHQLQKQFLDLKMKQMRTGRGSQSSVTRLSLSSMVARGLQTSSFLLHHKPCKAEGELPLPDSPVESSRLSVHPNLHEFEPGQTEEECVLTKEDVC